MSKTKIEWTDESSNPVEFLVDGQPGRGWFCMKVSPGCAHCYSEGMNNWVGNRLRYVKGNEGRVSVRLKERELERISRLRVPKRIFMFDMTDLFHPMFSDDFIFVIFDFIREHPQHTFQVLTKRAERMCELVCRYVDDYHSGKPLSNMWLMVSAEDQERADERIPWLLRMPGMVRGVSCEPMLGKIDLKWWLYPDQCVLCSNDPFYQKYADGVWACPHCEDATGKPDQGCLEWVIAGGESGRGSRPVKQDWVRSLRDQCQAAGTAFFFKQWGGVRKKEAGRLLDGVVWGEFPVSSEEVGSDWG